MKKRQTLIVEFIADKTIFDSGDQKFVYVQAVEKLGPERIAKLNFVKGKSGKARAFPPVSQDKSVYLENGLQENDIAPVGNTGWYVNTKFSIGDKERNLKRFAAGLGVEIKVRTGPFREETKAVGTEKSMSLNTILYGPPGTGKTYNTVIYTVAIIEGKSYATVKKEAKADYQKVLKRFQAFRAAGRVEFVTFHQSYGYEDFIEGIRPDVEGDELRYDHVDGAFKRFCLRASDTVWGRRFDDAYGRFLEKIEDQPFELETSTGAKFRVQVNSKGNLTIFTGSEFKKNGALTRENLRRAVEAQTGFRYLKSYYRAVKDLLEKEYGLKKSEEAQAKSVNGLGKEPYVFIIDEINRGNVSRVFGELITLIEKSKRIGAIEEMRIALPYSQDGETFGVPGNLYILGTMNTADRSLAALDTALRRRFDFIEMMPDAEVVGAESKIPGVDIKRLFVALNSRIEYLIDREHQIGHASFLGLHSLSDLENCFRRNVVPLLQEYFFDDYAKIRLVLGDATYKRDKRECQFFRERKFDDNLFGGRPEGLEDEGVTYELQEAAFSDPNAYVGIYAPVK